MKPILHDGSLSLVSSGHRFGDPGFYLGVQRDGSRLSARYVSAPSATRAMASWLRSQVNAVFDGGSSRRRRLVTFSYEFELGQPEQVRASRVVFNRRTSARLSYVVLVLAMLLLGIWGHLASRGRGSAVIVLTVLAGTLGGAAAIYMSPYWVVRGLRRKNRASDSVHKYELASSGISATSLGASSTISWPNVVEIYETSEFLFFYVSSAWAWLLPKRVVPAADLPRLRESLCEWVGERAHLR